MLATVCISAVTPFLSFPNLLTPPFLSCLQSWSTWFLVFAINWLMKCFVFRVGSSHFTSRPHKHPRAYWLTHLFFIKVSPSTTSITGSGHAPRRHLLSGGVSCRPSKAEVEFPHISSFIKKFTRWDGWDEIWVSIHNFSFFPQKLQSLPSESNKRNYQSYTSKANGAASSSSLRVFHLFYHCHLLATQLPPQPQKLAVFQAILK